MPIPTVAHAGELAPSTMLPASGAGDEVGEAAAELFRGGAG
ncbi:hypothetical protein [Rathayibacter toxicus]|nr:hypothetical protein [Rathayibacter toxicus]